MLNFEICGEYYENEMNCEVLWCGIGEDCNIRIIGIKIVVVEILFGFCIFLIV